MWKQREYKKKYNKHDDIITKLSKIHGIDDIDEFLYPSQKSLHDPYELQNIDVARNMILNAIASNQRISLFWDVDLDGACSGAILYNFLINFTSNVELFSNSRVVHGHGIQHATSRIPEGTELLIIVDSSTSDTDACKEISERGIDIVILDHHEPERDNPYATIVNCQLDDSKNKQLSGAGHCYKMIQVLDDTLGTSFAEYFIDLAGIGIQGDACSMIEKENRYIVSEAIKEIRNIGVKALLSVNKKDIIDLRSSDISFTIAPAINGALRMDRADLAIGLLTCKDIDEAIPLAKEITKLNEQRKKQQAYFTNKFMQEVNEDDNVIIIIDDEVNKGFSGVVAGELVGKLHRPVMVLKPSGKSGNVYSGSYRSPDGLELKTHLEEFKDLLTFIGGHPKAGGLGIPSWKFDEFKEKLNDSLKHVTFQKEIVYDLELDADDISQRMIRDIMKFTRINGTDIPEARFKVTNLFVGDVKILGKSKNTVKIITDQLELLKFRTDESFLDSVPTLVDVEAVGSVQINEYYNYKNRTMTTTNQLFLDDINVL